MQPRTKNLIQLNIAVLLWGGTAMFAKGIELPISTITCLRSVVTIIALLLYLWAVGTATRVKSRRHALVMVLLGLFLCLHWLTYFAALRISTAAVAIIALHTYPVITALVEPFMFREKLKLSDVGLAIVIFIGVAIMTPEYNLSNTTSQGIALGVVSGLFFMVRNLLTRRFVQQYTPSTLMFYQAIVASVLLLPVLFYGPDVTYTAKSCGLVVLLGVCFTAVPHTLFSASMKHLSTKTVSILAMLLPFYAAFFGYLIHDEKVTLRTAIGGLIVLACIACETARSVGKRAGQGQE